MLVPALLSTRPGMQFDWLCMVTCPPLNHSLWPLNWHVLLGSAPTMASTPGAGSKHPLQGIAKMFY